MNAGVRYVVVYIPHSFIYPNSRGWIDDATERVSRGRKRHEWRSEVTRRIILQVIQSKLQLEFCRGLPEDGRGRIRRVGRCPVNITIGGGAADIGADRHRIAKMGR